MRLFYLNNLSQPAARILATAMAAAALLMSSVAHAQLADLPASPALFTGEDRGQAINCLTTAIIREAGNEPRAGQEAVAQVIMNRVRATGYPKTVCGVVFQGSERTTGCQFTFTCDGSLRRPISDQARRNVQDISEMALTGVLPDIVADATHYHAFYVSPSWSRTLTKVGQIGAHIFYRSGAGPAPGRAVNLMSYAPKNEAGTSPSAPPPKPFLPWGLGLAANVQPAAREAASQP